MSSCNIHQCRWRLDHSMSTLTNCGTLVGSRCGPRSTRGSSKCTRQRLVLLFELLLKVNSGTENIFMPLDRMINGIVFVLSVCLSVVNFNHRSNFWTERDTDFILGMHTPLIMPFQMAPRSMTFWPWFWPLC